VIKEILPKQGLVYSEKNTLTELLCKPKIMPIKSLTLEKLEQMQKEANAPPPPSPPELSERERV
jgi:BBSome-interacting protein 1